MRSTASVVTTSDGGPPGRSPPTYPSARCRRPPDPAGRRPRSAIREVVVAQRRPGPRRHADRADRGEPVQRRRVGHRARATRRGSSTWAVYRTMRGGTCRSRREPNGGGRLPWRRWPCWSSNGSSSIGPTRRTIGRLVARRPQPTGRTRAMTFPLSFGDPAWLWLLLPVVGIVLAGWLGASRTLPAGRRIASLVIRLVLVACLVLSLAGARLVLPADRLSVVFLLDASASMLDATREELVSWARAAVGEMPEGDTAGVVVFGANGARRIGSPPTSASSPIPASRAGRRGADVAAAVRLAEAIMPAGTQRRLVLLSDGNDTSGEAEDAIAAATARGLRLDVVTAGGRGGGGGPGGRARRTARRAGRRDDRPLGPPAHHDRHLGHAAPAGRRRDGRHPRAASSSPASPRSRSASRPRRPGSTCSAPCSSPRTIGSPRTTPPMPTCW